MEIVQQSKQLDNFIRSNKEDIFIEVESKPSRLNNFYKEYNSKYYPKINDFSDGVIVLNQDANKWGLELRLYMHSKPTFIKGVCRNKVYRKEYEYRINDVAIIKELFKLGYRIGKNYK